MKFLTAILNKTKIKIKNTNIRLELGVDEIENVIQNSRLRCFGYVMRMREERIPKKMLQTRMEGKRPRGRPRTTWILPTSFGGKEPYLRRWLVPAFIRRLLDEFFGVFLSQEICAKPQYNRIISWQMWLTWHSGLRTRKGAGDTANIAQSFFWPQLILLLMVLQPVLGPSRCHDFFPSFSMYSSPSPTSNTKRPEVLLHSIQQS